MRSKDSKALATESKMLKLLRRIGEESPPPMRLSKLLQSPEQRFFSFRVSVKNQGISAKIFDFLGEYGLNIRFITEQTVREGHLHIQFCVDAEPENRILQIFQKEPFASAVSNLHHIPATIILSLYPFNGQPLMAKWVLSLFRLQGIEVLGINTAQSVLSCVIPAKDLDAALETLRDVFLFQ